MRCILALQFPLNENFEATKYCIIATELFWCLEKEESKKKSKFHLYVYGFSSNTQLFLFNFTFPNSCFINKYEIFAVAITCLFEVKVV